MNFDHNWINMDEDDEIFGFSYFSPLGPSYASRWPEEVLVPPGLKTLSNFKSSPKSLLTKDHLRTPNMVGKREAETAATFSVRTTARSRSGGGTRWTPTSASSAPWSPPARWTREMRIISDQYHPLPGDVSQDGQAHSSSTGSATPQGDPRQLGQLHWGQLQASHADGQGVEAADHPLRRWLPLRRRLGQGEDFICVRVSQSDSQLFSPGMLLFSIKLAQHFLSFHFFSGPDWSELIWHPPSEGHPKGITKESTIATEDTSTSLAQ